ncbi:MULTISPECIES: sensor histidine kinase [Nonlabens]|uniref:histidine kinase n=1 Tax=Nonlabens xylanidelens TaxID=191564 RepID=A0A2S6IKJ2_9FLAO|nr:histidine kinase [Nonlabens xylanidelens]PPK94753.1 signal transduction histidine kinase [Nonlabens xylanidelens]
MFTLLQISNTTINYVAIGLMVFIILFSVGMVIFFLLSRKRITKADLEVRDTKIKAQEDVIEATLLTQEKERHRIARELHDEISAKLNVISLNTNLLTDTTLSKDDRDLLLDRIQNATAKTLENARRLAHDLLPPVLERFGLCQALTELVDSIHNDQLKINFDCDWDESVLTSDQQLHTYRIVQELFNNSLKYSQANHIHLSLTTSNVKSMVYRDNGIGFQENTGKGLGTSNINSRVSILRGSMTLETSINQGVLYTFEFPTNP